jgi:hypothetical protein
MDQAQIPQTLAEIDERIAREHQLEQDAYANGHDGEAYWYVLDIERLRNLRRIVAEGSPVLDELQRARMRSLSERFARATWSGDPAAAALLKDQIERLERGQDVPR